MADETKPLLDQGIDACVEKLTDFGYNGITPEMVKQAHRNWKAGKVATDVIELFAFDDFDKYPEIFGRADA
jgi:hypothetical protein